MPAEPLLHSRPAGALIPSPQPLPYVDGFRFSKEATDFLARCLRVFAWTCWIGCLALLSIDNFYPWTITWTFPLATLLLTFLLLLPVPLYALRHREDLLVDEEIELAAERQERRAIRAMYSRPTRCYVWLFRIAAVVGCFVFYLAAGMSTASRLPLIAVAVGFATLLPVLFAFYFSRRLVRARADELDYIKGTSVGREVLVYWLVAVLVPLQQKLLPELATVPPEFSAALTNTLTVVAMSRMLGPGYKDYREAMAKAPRSDR